MFIRRGIIEILYKNEKIVFVTFINTMIFFLIKKINTMICYDNCCDENLG